MTTASLASTLALRTPYKREVWLEALSRVPAHVDEDDVADVVTAMTSTGEIEPAEAVNIVWPREEAVLTRDVRVLREDTP